MGTTNNPRKNTKGGRAHRMELALEGVKDRATREALEVILEFVREMISGGLQLDGDFFARSIETDTGGAWRVKVFDSTIIARDAGGADTTDLKVPGVILGAFGYSQVSGGSGWQVMSWSSSASHLGAYWYLGGSNTDRKLQIRNNDTVNANRYRAIIFYTGDRA